MGKKLLRITLSAAILILITMGTAQADTAKFLSMIKHKHHSHVMTLITQLLKNQDKHFQHTTIKEIIRLEADMAPFAKDANDFYINRLKATDLEQVPGQILQLYLSDKGQPMNTARFFEGRTFTYYK